MAGASGAFAGLEDEFIAILDSAGTQLRVHATKDSKGSAPPVLRALEVFPPGADALFPGPAWGSLPRCAPGTAAQHPVPSGLDRSSCSSRVLDDRMHVCGKQAFSRTQ